MPHRTTQKTAAAVLDEEIPDTEMQQHLVLHHDEIAAKLMAAQQSIASGEAVSLEPLSVLLRDARRHARANR